MWRHRERLHWDFVTLMQKTLNEEFVRKIIQWHLDTYTSYYEKDGRTFWDTETFENIIKYQKKLSKKYRAELESKLQSNSK